jgi:hypothetical protein
MGTVLIALSIGLALLQAGAVARVRRLSTYVGRASGVLLVVVGGYVMYYWFAVLSSPTAAFDNPAVATVTRVSGRLQNALAPAPGRGLMLGVMVILIALAGWAWLGRRAHTGPLAGAAGNSPDNQVRR